MDNKILKSLTTNKRQVNIELLRIIAMILVLLNHSTWNAKYFNIDMVHTDLLTSVGVLEVYGWIFVCVPCFVVISGYFGIHWKWKGLFNYLFQIGFWGGMVYLVTWSLGLHDFHPLAFIKNMTCFLSGVNWFFYAYFVKALAIEFKEELLKKSIEYLRSLNV